MEKINRKPLSDIPKLQKLAENWELWGKEHKLYRDTKGESGKPFSWKLRKNLLFELEIQTKGHCSFCDSYPFGKTSTKQIEHYYPKADFPLKAYEWENLFYCCNQCNTYANADKPFKFTVKSDMNEYYFDDYFWFDAETGELKVYEHLEQIDIQKFRKAHFFLKRYGINSRERNEARLEELDVIRLKLNANRVVKREKRAYRYIFDYVQELLNIDKTE